MSVSVLNLRMIKQEDELIFLDSLFLTVINLFLVEFFLFVFSPPFSPFCPSLSFIFSLDIEWGGSWNSELELFLPSTRCPQHWWKLAGQTGFL